ncbi:MAG: C40 family peptidase [Desulfitobacteriaceae bacterium]|nr:C40 family peptidase [Desulfitobacteriaceae bacterium]MDD4345747.1 C40 family peptidase [Desulfitobacteriaceae bacterium]MDD4400952.1 C40 family peptidase [Desulfitobacteriaceae bacterium]
MFQHIRSKGMWLGFVTVSGLFLFGIIPWANTHSNTTNDQILFKELSVKANQIPSEPYAQVIQEQFKLTTEVVLPVVTAVHDNQKTVKTATTPKIPVQTALTSNSKVSRGGSDKSSLINNALSLRGIPYVWGGTTRKGFDCSGFTQYVFGGSKISLPRTAAEQYKVGTPVSRNQLQQGDLVFFTTYAPGASHVGIYTSGGNFIHASTKGVKISSLNESYYATHYIGARRVK